MYVYIYIYIYIYTYIYIYIRIYTYIHKVLSEFSATASASTVSGGPRPANLAERAGARGGRLPESRLAQCCLRVTRCLEDLRPTGKLGQGGPTSSHDLLAVSSRCGGAHCSPGVGPRVRDDAGQITPNLHTKIIPKGHENSTP